MPSSLLMFGSVVALFLSQTMSSWAQPPRFNDKPLKGVSGYKILAVMVNPILARRMELDPKGIQAIVESQLKEAAILAGDDRSSSIASVFIRIALAPKEPELIGWYAVIEVREPARLERAPDSGIVMAVTWDQAAQGVSSLAHAKSTIESAVQGPRRRIGKGTCAWRACYEVTSPAPNRARGAEPARPVCESRPRRAGGAGRWTVAARELRSRVPASRLFR